MLTHKTFVLLVACVCTCLADSRWSTPRQLRTLVNTREFGCLADYTWVVQGQVICYNSTGGYCAGEANGLFSAWIQFEDGIAYYYREDTILQNSALVYSRFQKTKAPNNVT